MIASADGCKGGWVVALAEAWPCSQKPVMAVCNDFSSLIEVTKDYDSVVVDMPIGLPADTMGRSCDAMARDHLGSAGASRVFSIPPRGSLDARSPIEFQIIVKRLTGRGAGLPVWGIVPKLREVDAAMTPRLQQRVMEFHPELAWSRLAGCVLHSKHSTEGIDQRRSLLGSHLPDLATIENQRLNFTGCRVYVDDVFDSLIGLMVAQGILDGNLPPNRLPQDNVPLDERDLRMEIWY